MIKKKDELKITRVLPFRTEWVLLTFLEVEPSRILLEKSYFPLDHVELELNLRYQKHIK
jgi:hypothetical protein